jgi:hypothetical protein
MKKFYICERLIGPMTLMLLALCYLVFPRSTEDHLAQALGLRKLARKTLHGE